MESRNARMSVFLGRGTAAALLALLGGACGDVEEELLDALQTEENQMLCVSPSVLGVDAFEANDGKRYVARAGEFSFMASGSSVDALDALREKGYVSEEAISMPNFASSFDAWEITKKGAEFFKPDAFNVGIDVCVGEKEVTEILEYTEPGDNGPQAIQARFLYEIHLNDFVDDLDIEDALEEELGRTWPGEGMAVYTKTNKGWRLEHALWQ